MGELTDSAPAATSTVPDRLYLEAFLAELRHEPHPVLFFPNPGNAGDAMIAHATHQLFQRVGLEYEWVGDHRRLDLHGRVVVYGGGGNLVPLYDTASRVLRWADRGAKRVILLPHTISGLEDLLADLGPQTDLICRELVSFRHVRGAVRSARCHLADDLAISMDVSATLKTPPAPVSALRLYGQRLRYRISAPSLRRTVASPRKLRRSERLLARRRTELRTGGATQVLDVFRTDAEKTDLALPAGNLDLPRLMAFGTRDINISHTGAFHLLRYLDLFDEVRTNRLHVAIGAALLGKRVKFHPNSYFKNRAVYEFSMLGRFHDVEWVGERQRSPSRLRSS